MGKAGPYRPAGCQAAWIDSELLQRAIGWLLSPPSVFLPIQGLLTLIRIASLLPENGPIKARGVKFGHSK